MKCGFPESKWYELGLRLGLHKYTLDIIEANHPGDRSRCLIECLTQWLHRADNVDSRGGATWDSLSTALRSMDEVAIADELDKESELLSINFSSDSFYRITSSSGTQLIQKLSSSPLSVSLSSNKCC